MRLVHILVVGLAMLSPANSFAGPAEDASAIIDRWADGLSVNDTDAVLKLYTSDAVLHGISSPKLHQGSEAIREYLKGAPESGNKVMIGERHMVVLGDATVMGVGFFQVNLLQDGVRLRRLARFTLIMVRRGSDWLIAHQHSSALPPAPLQ